MAIASPVQVLVVGAGPTGLFMASELARHGVTCRIVDRNGGPAGQSRATTVQPRTLEILDAVELVDAFVAAGVPCHSIGTYTPELIVLNRVSHGELDSPFPFALSIPQSTTEELLARHGARLGASVEWRVTLRAIVQDDAGVTAALEHAGGGDETVRVPYLVACDGAHSAVRHALGVAFAGTDYPTDFAVADVRLDWRVAIPANEICFFVGPAGQMFYTPFADGRCLISGDLAAESPGPPRAGEPPLAELQALVDQRSPGGVVHDPGWRAYFRAHLRQAERYRVGRVFLAGDAAHVQSPAGGQGMNTGLQDAYNLGWKLGLVLNGRGAPSLLDSYHPERHRAGRDMLVLNDYLYHLEMEHLSGLPLSEAVRRRLALVLAGQDVIQQRIKRAVAELDINYRHSPAVAQHRSLVTSPGGSPAERHGWRDFGAAPHAGDRATDARLLRHPSGEVVRFSKVRRGTKHHLLLFAGPHPTPATGQYLQILADATAQRHGATVDTHLVVPPDLLPPAPFGGSILIDPRGELHHRYGARTDCLYVIRPDGYVGFRSQPADRAALDAFLARMFV